jgi:hypothetical protein
VRETMDDDLFLLSLLQLSFLTFGKAATCGRPDHTRGRRRPPLMASRGGSGGGMNSVVVELSLAVLARSRACLPACFTRRRSSRGWAPG